MRKYYRTMRMQARQIEAFRAVMLTGGMTAAAETLHITQPAVSRLIKDLEAALNLTLFDRRGNQITPTAEAVELFSEVERTYLGLEFIEKRANDLRNLERGSLRIAAHPAMALGFLPNYIATFVRQHPDLSILLDGIPSHLVLERVAGGQFDLGFAAHPVERPSLSLTPIPASAVVILRRDHPLAERDQISAEDLVNERIILLGKGSLFRHKVESALGTTASSQKIETPLSAIACSFVLEGLGLTITDPFSAINLMANGLVARPFVPPIDVGVTLVVPNHREPSRLAKAFIAGLAQGIESYLTAVVGASTRP
ncbi:LysR family transcriptional regulator [Methylobacterium sp. NFXW15]|uniref:LysR family transcriptional regulator n=1 Tax=Methylobacterium sp. NFXW15 TaxID=2819512 RepID=UPI003CF57DE2